MNGNTKKTINIVYRVFVFLGAVLSVMMIINMIKFALIMDKNDDSLTTEFMNAVNMFSILYMALFCLTIVCFILSILAKYKCSSAGHVIRTMFFAIVICSMGLGLRMAAAMRKVTDFIEEIGKVDLNITENNLLEAGMDADEARKLGDTLGDENALVFFVVGMCVCVVVYTVFTFTSLHNLIKKDKKAEGEADQIEGE